MLLMAIWLIRFALLLSVSLSFPFFPSKLISLSLKKILKHVIQFKFALLTEKKYSEEWKLPWVSCKYCDRAGLCILSNLFFFVAKKKLKRDYAKSWMVRPKVRKRKVRSSSIDIDSISREPSHFSLTVCFVVMGVTTCCFIFKNCRIVWRTWNSNENATFCSNKLTTLFHITNFHRVALLHFMLDTVTPRRDEKVRMREKRQGTNWIDSRNKSYIFRLLLYPTTQIVKASTE